MRRSLAGGGLLLNFSAVPLTVKRVIYNSDNAEESRKEGVDAAFSSFPDFLSDDGRR
jgi:hypothetical protein